MFTRGYIPIVLFSYSSCIPAVPKHVQVASTPISRCQGWMMKISRSIMVQFQLKNKHLPTTIMFDHIYNHMFSIINMFIDVWSIFVALVGASKIQPSPNSVTAQTISNHVPKVAMKTLQQQEQKHMEVAPIRRHPQRRASLAVGLSRGARCGVRQKPVGNIHSIPYNVGPPR
jgi:hypothetical protein